MAPGKSHRKGIGIKGFTGKQLRYQDLIADNGLDSGSRK